MAPSPNLTIGSPDSSNGEVPRMRAHYQDQPDGCDAIVSEMEEELSSEGGDDYEGNAVYRLSTIREEVGTVFSYDFDGGEDAVYVAVEKESREDTSMDAVIWTVKNAVVDTSSTVVFLLHVFPETKFIPSPLGMLPVSQVNPQHKEIYLSEQKAKRRDFLKKFINVCSASQVKVDTLLIESDKEAKAILDLIPILHMRKLVIGVTKSTIRKMKSKKGNTVAEQILLNAPEFCDVKIIYEGKEMSELAWDSLSLSSSSSFSSRASDHHSFKFVQEEGQMAAELPATCGCFKL